MTLQDKAEHPVLSSEQVQQYLQGWLNLTASRCVLDGCWSYCICFIEEVLWSVGSCVCAIIACRVTFFSVNCGVHKANASVGAILGLTRAAVKLLIEFAVVFDEGVRGFLSCPHF